MSETSMTEQTSNPTNVDVVVVGGGPAGASAANALARAGHSVILLHKPGRIKPCGGAVPPRLVKDFAIPDHLIKARASSARMISPKGVKVDMPIDGGYVGMVDRESFDEWLRERARSNGALRIDGSFVSMDSNASEGCTIEYKPTTTTKKNAGDAALLTLKARVVIGADGANSAVGKQSIPGADCIPFVAAYHEIVSATPADETEFDPARCEVYYQGKISPDFYGWVFPHGDVVSIGVGSAVKGYKLRAATTRLREDSGYSSAETIRREGAPIPLKVLKRWDNRRNVILAGDAAGVVAPASGEGIYYAMRSGQLVAEAVSECLNTNDARALSGARKQFMRENGKVFLVLKIMQRFWYHSDRLREKFVHICKDKDVQRLTWEAYMNKTLVKKQPMAHIRIFFKDLAHLCGLAQPR